MLTAYKHKQAVEYIALREMTLLGGKWVGERIQWSAPEDESIRLEIFYASPTPILHAANHMLAQEYPALGKPVTQHDFAALEHSIVSFTLRDSNNSFLAIVSAQLPSNKQDGLLILQFIVDKTLRRARNGTFLLQLLAEHAKKLSIDVIAVKILDYMPKKFFMQQGYKTLRCPQLRPDAPCQNKLVLLKNLTGSPRALVRPALRYGSHC